MKPIHRRVIATLQPKLLVAVERISDEGVLNPMLLTIAIILLVLWLLGVVSSYTISGFIHILLVAAVILVLVRIIRGENPLK